MQEAFTAAGIESVILKGPGLLVAHYPDIGARHVGDVDILVREGMSRGPRRLVLALSALEPPLLRYDGTRAGPAEPGETSLAARVPAHGIALEIHQGQPAAERGGSAFDEILDGPRRSRGRAVAAHPSVPDLAASACLHVFDHHEGQETSSCGFSDTSP